MVWGGVERVEYYSKIKQLPWVAHRVVSLFHTLSNTNISTNTDTDTDTNTNFVRHHMSDITSYHTVHDMTHTHTHTDSCCRRNAPVDVFLLRYRYGCCCFALCGCGEDLRSRLCLVHLARVHHRQWKPGKV